VVLKAQFFLEILLELALDYVPPPLRFIVFLRPYKSTQSNVHGFSQKNNTLNSIYWPTKI